MFQASQVVLVVKKKSPVNAEDRRDEGLIPGGGHGNQLQYSCLENPVDRGTWWATVHAVTDSWTRQKRLATHAYICDTITTKARTVSPPKVSFYPLFY